MWQSASENDDRWHGLRLRQTPLKIPQVIGLFGLQILPTFDRHPKFWRNWPISPMSKMFHHVHHVSPCFTMFHHVSPCFTTFHHVSPCFTMFHHVSPCFTMFLSPCFTTFQRSNAKQLRSEYLEERKELVTELATLLRMVPGESGRRMVSPWFWEKWDQRKPKLRGWWRRVVYSSLFWMWKMFDNSVLGDWFIWFIHVIDRCVSGVLEAISEAGVQQTGCRGAAA